MSAKGSGGTLLEEGRVIDFENRHVESRHEDLHLGRYALGRLVRLHENLTGIADDVGVGENPLAGKDHAAAGYFAGRILGPGANKVRLTQRRMDLHDGIGNLVLGIGRSRKKRQQEDGSRVRMVGRTWS